MAFLKEGYIVVVELRKAAYPRTFAYFLLAVETAPTP